MSELKKFDTYLDDGGPAAVVLREHLMPVEGLDGVVFPATFAAGDSFPGGYNINSFGDEKDGNNVCLTSTRLARKPTGSNRFLCARSIVTSFRRSSLQSANIA